MARRVAIELKMLAGKVVNAAFTAASDVFATTKDLRNISTANATALAGKAVSAAQTAAEKAIMAASVGGKLAGTKAKLLAGEAANAATAGADFVLNKVSTATKAGTPAARAIAQALNSEAGKVFIESVTAIAMAQVAKKIPVGKPILKMMAAFVASEAAINFFVTGASAFVGKVATTTEATDSSARPKQKGAKRTVPRSKYLSLRSKFQPKEMSLIIIAESPPASGKYFYNPAGSVKEPLFMALMQILELTPLTKEEGLREFQKRDWVLVDATYKPVNARGSADRDKITLRNYSILHNDLAALLPKRNVPIILIKENVCRLLEHKLTQDGLNWPAPGSVDTRLS